jgi:hypothetical protein
LQIHTYIDHSLSFLFLVSFEALREVLVPEI